VAERLPLLAKRRYAFAHLTCARSFAFHAMLKLCAADFEFYNQRGNVARCFGWHASIGDDFGQVLVPLWRKGACRFFFRK
jgi:hypothetical protein